MSLRAPPPDFRYVGLRPESPRRSAVWGVLAFGAVAAGIVASPLPLEQGAMGFLGAGAAAALVARRLRHARQRSDGTLAGATEVSDGPGLALVPWGVLVETGGGLRALRWAAVKNVEMTIVHGRDDLTPITRFSQVRIDTAGGALVGYASGAAPLDRLVAHLGAYAGEQGCAVALDFAGTRTVGRAFDPPCEPLLAAVKRYLTSGDAYADLALPSASYRTSWTRAPSHDTLATLRAVLTGRDAEPVDRRPFASVVAAELHAADLVDELVALVDSPHPIVASVAKAAALRLGAATSRVGSLDEVAPFLAPSDLEALTVWSKAS